MGLRMWGRGAQETLARELWWGREQGNVRAGCLVDGARGVMGRGRGSFMGQRRHSEASWFPQKYGH